ncbi:MAG: porin [Bdellovibrio sp.]
MKKFLITTLISATAISAQAGSLSLDMRADYNSTSFNAPSDRDDTTRFFFKTGRLDYQGKATEDLTFRLRVAFNKDATVNANTAANESLQPAVEYGYLSHKLSDTFTLTVGKFNTEFGGWEGITSGADLYLTSEFYTRTALMNAGAGTLSPYNLGTRDLLYGTGVKATFAFGGQQIHLMGTDEPANSPAAVGPATTQNSSMYGVAYKGAFMDKALNLALSYHTMAGPIKDDKHQFIAAGVTWNSAPVMVTADYLVSEFKQDASGKKDTMTSIVAKLAYTGWEQWTPRLEFTTSEDKQQISSALSNKFTGMGAVLEYKPYNDQTFRYHIAYNNITEKRDTGADLKKDEVIVGARLLADFLK